MLRVVVLVSGGGTNFEAIMEAIHNGTITNTEVVGLISNKKDAYALQRANNHGIPAVCISPKDYDKREKFNIALLEALEGFKPDLIVLAGYLVILPEVIIKTYKNRMINIHPSLIPAFCGDGFYGLRVHEAVLSRGNKVTGATVHYVDEGTDTGPILLQKAVDVKNDDTPEILQKRVMEEAEWVILPKAINLIANGKVLIDNHRAVVCEG